jgi:hypothetical protein
VVTAKKQDFKAYGIDIRFSDDALRVMAGKAHEEKTGARALISVMEKTLVSFERVLPSVDVKRFTVTRDLAEDPRPFLEAILADEFHPSRCEIFEEVDACERNETMQELKSRRAEFEQLFGKALEGKALEVIVEAAAGKGVSPDTMYKRYIKVEQEIKGFEDEFFRTYGLKIRFLEEALLELARLSLSESEEPLIVCRKIFQNYHHGLKLVMERADSSEFLIPKEAVHNPEKYLNEIIQQTYRS